MADHPASQSHHHHAQHHHRPEFAHQRTVFLNITKKFCGRTLSIALQKWRTTCFTKEELAQKRRRRQLNSQAESILVSSRPGQRTEADCATIETWIQEAFPHLFTDSLLVKNQAAASGHNTLVGTAVQMDSRSLRRLAQSVFGITWPAGHVLFQQGQKADCVYGVINWEADVFVHDFNITGGRRRRSVDHGLHETSRVKSNRAGFLGKLVGKLSHGKILGELGLSSDRGERSASVILRTKTSLMCIDKDTYNQCFRALRQKIRMRYRRVKTLAKLYFFNDWADSRLDHLFYPMHELLVRRGTVLVRQGLSARGMYILLSGTAMRHWEGNGLRIETSWASDGAVFGFEDIVTALSGGGAKAKPTYLPLETVTISSNTATVLFLAHEDFGNEMERFTNTHTISKMIDAIAQRKKIIDQARALRSKIEDQNEAVLRAHVSGGHNNLHSFGGFNRQWFNETIQHRIRVPDAPLGARQKLRLGLIPKRYRSHVKQSTLLNSTCALPTVVRRPPPPQSKTMATTRSLQDSLVLTEFDLSRISAAEAAARGELKGGAAAVTVTDGGSLWATMSTVRDKLDKLSARREPRVAQRPADRHRAAYLSGKRARWMKAARKAARHARRKRRKAPQLDEFDDRINRPVLSHLRGLVGTNVRRL